MPILIRDSADPLSGPALHGEQRAILVHSEAGRILQHDLHRYCNGQIQGRSFLIAGHRGAGKTTMVADALAQTLSHSTTLRPLPIFLSGPSLLETLPSDLGYGGLSLVGTKPTAGGAARPAMADGIAGANAQPQGASADGKAHSTISVDDEKQAQLALVHVILGLHRAVVKEFATQYRLKTTHMHEDAESGELAGQFELELFEDPPASRLAEYWRRAQAMAGGILFERGRPADQGVRELVAINGICNAHQRISGALSGSDTVTRDATQEQKATRGFDLPTLDVLKSFGIVTTGAAVTAGTAAANPDLLVPGLLGVLAACAAALVLKSSSTTSSKRGRTLDRSFIPDLTPRTLDRVLPALLDRLRSAGLAPVLVVDELDKVERLPDRISGMIRHLKKLMAESVFSCFLADRNYLECLRLDPDDAIHGCVSSYFSHRLLVCYSPSDFDAYLDEILVLSNSGTGIDADPEAPVAHMVLKWVLRHRSQLHALNLNRQLAALRDDQGRVRIPAGKIRSELQYRIDVTFQVAIELQLHSEEVMGWVDRQPEMQQVLFDALYYLSRSWLRGEEHVDLSTQQLMSQLAIRMNLDRTHGSASQSTQSSVLDGDNLEVLARVVKAIVGFLSPQTTHDDVTATWEEIAKRQGSPARNQPTPDVMSCLLLGDKSLLTAAPITTLPSASGSRLHTWRYLPSGRLRDPIAAELSDTTRIRSDAALSIEYITSVERILGAALLDTNSSDNIPVFNLLGDRHRVLVTTPAWSQVRAAIDNLALLGQGTGNPISIAEDCRCIEDFAEILKQGSDAVLALLRCAALLRGVGDAATPALRLGHTVKLLAIHLELAKVNAAGVGTRVHALWHELRNVGNRVGHDVPLSVDTADASLSLTSNSLLAELEQLSAIGRRWLFDWAEQSALAWQSLQQRFDLQQAKREFQIASLPEILCAARGCGPSVWVGPDLESVSLRSWSRIILHTTAPDQATGGVTPPYWLVMLAIRRLGGSTLSAAAAARLLARVQLARSSDPAPRILQPSELQSAVQDRCLLVVCSSPSLTNAWSIPPSLGITLIIDPREYRLEDALALLGHILPDASALVGCEEPCQFPEIQQSILKQKLRSLRLYPHGTDPSRVISPALIDPASPDDIFKRS